MMLSGDFKGKSTVMSESSQTGAHEPLLPRQGDSVGETTPLLDRNEERSSCCCSTRTQTTALILLMLSVLCMGQNLIAPHLTDIAQDFGFTDAERDTKVGGELSFSLFLVGAPAALVIGYYADRVNRRTLFALVVFMGQGGHILVLFVTKFWQLFVLRALTGISLGGSIPLVFSMVGDMYADHERPPVSAAVGMASGIGMGAGQLMSAIVGDLYGWRMPFAVVAVAACLMSLLFFMLATEPKRGAHERFALLAAGNVREDGELPDESVSVQGVGERAEADGTGESKVAGGGSDQEKTLWGAVRDEWARVKQGMRDIFSRRSNWIIFLQGIPGCVPGSMIGVFLNDYLYIDKHAPSKLAALAVCAGWGAGNMFGQVLGGWLGQRLLYAPQEKRHYICYVMGLTCLLPIAPMLVILNSDFSFYLAGVAFAGGSMSAVNGPLINSVALNVNTPDTRGRVFAIFTLTDDIGKGLGPPLIGTLVVAFGRNIAFNISTLLWVLCGALLLLLRWTMTKDELSVAADVAAQVHGTAQCRAGAGAHA